MGGLVFGGSNQVPLINVQNPGRNIYLKDLKSFVVSPPNLGYTIKIYSYLTNVRSLNLLLKRRFRSLQISITTEILICPFILTGKD